MTQDHMLIIGLLFVILAQMFPPSLQRGLCSGLALFWFSAFAGAKLFAAHLWLTGGAA